MPETSSTITIPSGKWVPQVLASLDHKSAQLRVPLAVFFNETVRGEVERELGSRDCYPQWDLASKSVSDRGAPIRLVPVLQVKDLE